MSDRAYCPAPKFSIGDARRIVADLFEPRPWIYWTDLLVTSALGLGAFNAIRFVARSELSPAAKTGIILVLWVISVLGIYRAALFTHELTHFRQGSFKAFRAAWNVLCGIPFLMPSFLYHTHVAHHMRRHYGTPEDGEYIPFGSRPPSEMLWYLSQSFIIPLLAVVRFLVFTPIAWVSPRFRRWVQRRASSMIIDPSYVRPLPTTNELWIWRVQEAAVFLYILAAIAVVAFGPMHPLVIVQAYVTGVAVIMLNAVRSLGAHRYLHQGEEMNFVDQLLDSINFPQHAISGEIWAPVGLRFHALHHLFPSMPYHNLGIAHRRLMQELPADSPYRRTNSPSLHAALDALWQRARASVGVPATSDVPVAETTMAKPEVRASGARAAATDTVRAEAALTDTVRAEPRRDDPTARREGGSRSEVSVRS